MGSRGRRVFTEAYRFLAVGGVATIVAFLIFNFLVHGFNTTHKALLDNEPYLAYVIANLVGMVVSYRGSRTWVFKDRPPTAADGGRTAFIAINLGTMLIPIGCLWLSRNVLGLDDPWSDNVSANVIGLFLGLIARFYLFRTYVFRRPVHLPDLMHNPLQVFEMSELQDIEPLDDLADVVDPEDPDQPDVAGERVSERPTDPSTCGRAPQPGP
ncbi:MULTISPECIES: GtrA family protein [unclassified Nocardioides]|uniref:GtrA family protein n=1 Tax=unclassified Nocardioides TaxID=2615069 RepID=UPI0009EFE209|nr:MULTISPECIES: GtrA family protein [unclassified Nocardioides]GAW50791.1 GtrA family protein [Nocardioides sp. PD653-B2]GAW52730.1 GtrA family protein [Nocardioides sp. PD653]